MPLKNDGMTGEGQAKDGTPTGRGHLLIELADQTNAFNALGTEVMRRVVSMGSIEDIEVFQYKRRHIICWLAYFALIEEGGPFARPRPPSVRPPGDSSAPPTESHSPWRPPLRSTSISSEKNALGLRAIGQSADACHCSPKGRALAAFYFPSVANGRRMGGGAFRLFGLMLPFFSSVTTNSKGPPKCFCSKMPFN